MIIKKDPSMMQSYFEDTSNLKGGHADSVFIPDDERELADILSEANSKKTPVTISGGGTGTTGSRIPFGGIIISTERLNKIVDVSEKNMDAVVQPGVMVEDFKKACDRKGLFYTCHPTENTASLGGTVATNASGARSFRYGPTRNYVKRLKMIMADGKILDLNRGEYFLNGKNAKVRMKDGYEISIPLPSYKMPAVKNSAGYFAKDGMDLIDLFIGQEGTLSVITEIGLKLVKKPHGILSVFVFFTNPADSWNFAQEARKTARSKPVLSIEYFDANALNIVHGKNKSVPGTARAAIFFEQEIPAGKKNTDYTDDWISLIVKHNASTDNTWVAMNDKEARLFTDLRHAVPEGANEIVKRNGFHKLSGDMAVPGKSFMEMSRFYADSFAQTQLDHMVFGHIGEYHLHANIFPKSEEELSRGRELYIAFIKKAVSLGGTVSAEHGIGKIKHKYLEIMYGEAGILEMAHIKKSLDPNCILGLDNIFPREVLIHP